LKLVLGAKKKGRVHGWTDGRMDRGWMEGRKKGGKEGWKAEDTIKR
jgi:hypothetical protein